MDTANSFAYVVLIAWLPLSALLFAQLPPALAAGTSLLGASLLLPVRIAFDLPGLPPIDRDVICGLGALGGCLLFRPELLRGWLPSGGVALLLVLLVTSPMLTALSNPDALFYGGRALPGLRPYDGFGLVFDRAARVALPFLLGRQLVRNPRDASSVLRLLVGAALLYTLPTLIELRMSPNIHRWIYGYHPHSFLQHIRWGGWRPVVCMSHGLELSLFMATASVAALGLVRRRARVLGVPTGLAGLFLAGVLVLCKSLGGLVYGSFGLLAALVARPRLQIRVTALVALLVLSYPALRTAGLFPTGSLVAAANWVSPERGASLATRFDNEDALLAKARERIAFGWGSWGRYRIYDERGKDISLTDGYWIIDFASYGLLGFGASFGLLVAPLLAALLRLSRLREQRQAVPVATLALVVAIRTLDLLPNAFFSPFGVFLSGSLAGVVARLPAPSRRRRAAAHPGAATGQPAGAAPAPSTGLPAQAPGLAPRRGQEWRAQRD